MRDMKAQPTRRAWLPHRKGDGPAMRSARGAFTTLAATVAFATVAVTPANAIVNGAADGADHPYVVALAADFVTPGYFQKFCTGALVTPRLVVTAAHCMTGFNDTQIWVNADPVYVPGTSTLTHGIGQPAVDPAIFRGNAGAQGGNNDLGNDIGVVHLDRDLVVSRYAQLPPPGLLSNMDLGNAGFTAVGYGATRVDGTKGPKNILPNIDPAVRNVATESFRSLQSYALSVSANPATGDGGTCYGDSGGPHLLPGTDITVAVTILGDVPCRSLGRHFRLDTPLARQFLASQGVPLP
jgi:secreted trypsin-like serine protease